jgi:hypothetical protein
MCEYSTAYIPSLHIPLILASLNLLPYLSLIINSLLELRLSLGSGKHDALQPLDTRIRVSLQSLSLIFRHTGPAFDFM